MRITRLDLLRFGKFTDKTVSLPHGAQDFHLIVGPNEAGKSTLRDAIQDLLFGIENRSRYNFVHAHSEMRLGALIEQGDRKLDFVRTKARTKTLQVANGSVLPDSALTPFLGQIDRGFFDQMFGLNHERLVKGGQEILSASNDVGQILFQAAAGIGSLGTIRDKLEQEADALWAPRKSDKREYYNAVNELEQAEAALKQTTVRTKDWQEARGAVDAIAAQLQAAREAYAELVQQSNRLERVRRVAPMLTTIEGLERQLVELGPVTALPESATEQLAQAERNIAIASQSLLLFETQTADLMVRIEAIHPDESILARGVDIEALSATRQQMRNVASDIAKREGEIQVLWQDVQEASRQLGWPLETEDAFSQRLPGKLVRSSMDGLVRRHEALTQALLTAQESLRARQEEVKAINAEIGLLPQDATPIAIVEALASARAPGDVPAQQKRLETQLRRLERDLQAAEVALGKWNPGLENLRTLMPPTLDETNSLIKRRSELELTATTLGQRITETKGEIQTLQLEISQYKATHKPVTLEDVGQGRSKRDATWQAIKVGAVKLSEAAPGYEHAVIEADGLSDQRHDKAQEETELQGRLDRLERLQQQMTDLNARIAENKVSLTSLDQLWDERVDGLGLSGMGLLQVNDWRSARDRVLLAAVALAEAQLAQKDLVQTASDAKAMLLQVMQIIKPQSENLKLTELILMADERVTAATRAHERRSTLLTQKVRAEVAIPELENRVAQAQQALATWLAELQKNLALAHLPTDTPIGSVADALSLFERMHQQVQKIREIRVNRIDMMRRDLDGFVNAARALALDIAPDMANQTGVEISISLDSLLKRHTAAANELERLTTDLDKAATQKKAASARIAEDRASLKPLLHVSGATSNDELRLAAANSDLMRSLLRDKDQALKLLLSAGDGLDRVALAAEFAATDAESLSSCLSESKRQTDEVVAQQNKLSGELTTAELTLGKIAGQSEAARAESQRQEALARMANALERYIKVYTAAKLLRWAIERFRETRQGPMLARASEVFLGLTQGAFSRLVVDYESEPLKLSGQRASGELVDIEGMSDGTRDQLYLALRLAALELHLEQSVPLPFIADDLFINYDDDRAKSGLQALAKLSESTQVIFLSHHAHLVPVAQAVLGDKLNIVRLD